MAIIHVLYGFSSEKIEKSINRELMLRGYEAKSVLRPSKELIRDYLTEHKEVSAVVLKEYLDGGGKYSAKELSELADITRANIVVVLAQNHRGKNEMKEIYSAGILSACFSDGKFGANPDVLAGLIVNGRGRKDARQYYRIDETVPDKINLTYEEYRECFKYLVNKRMGLNIVDRFVTISRWLYPGQMGAFCDMLPDKVKDILLQYREFYDIANKCYNLGYAKYKYKIPKGISKGITKEAVQERQISDVKRERGIVQSSAERVEIPSEERHAELETQNAEEKVENVPEPVEDKKAKKKVPKEKKEKKSGGLFGRKKNVDKADDRERVEPESLFEEDGDIDFSKVKEVNDIPSRSQSEEVDIPNEVADEVEEITDDVNTHQEIPADYETDFTAAEQVTEDTGADKEDYSNMSTEELLELFGK